MDKEGVMRVDLPGLLRERNRNGSPRWRVRVDGDKTRRLTLPVGPDHRDFLDHYHAARAGQVFRPDAPAEVERSVDWLCRRYLEHLQRLVDGGLASAATLRQKRSVLTRLCDYSDDEVERFGACDIDAPTAAFIAVRDTWADRPGAADNLIKTIKSVYKWAMDRGDIDHNPAAGIGTINSRGMGGAIPWTPDDLLAFKARHPKGTTPYLWLTLQAFTACRIGDAIWLGRGNEVRRNGELWLDWQPRKTGSAAVSVPMLPPLIDATRSHDIIGSTYLLTQRGTPFKSAESLRNKVREWCDDAGLPSRSSHGIRKAMGSLMAEGGATQHQIMAVMAHVQAKTSEIYTKGVARRILASDGIAALRAIDW